MKTITSGQIITTSAEVTLNGGLVRESPKNPLNSGLGIILICPDLYYPIVFQKAEVCLFGQLFGVNISKTKVFGSLGLL